MSKVVCPSCGYGDRADEKFNHGLDVELLSLPWLGYAEWELEKMLIAGETSEKVLRTNRDLLVYPGVEMLECPSCKRLLVVKDGDIVRVYTFEQNARVQVPTPGDLLDLFPQPLNLSDDEQLIRRKS